MKNSSKNLASKWRHHTVTFLMWVNHRKFDLLLFVALMVLTGGYASFLLHGLPAKELLQVVATPLGWVVALGAFLLGHNIIKRFEFRTQIKLDAVREIQAAVLKYEECLSRISGFLSFAPTRTKFHGHGALRFDMENFRATLLAEILAESDSFVRLVSVINTHRIAVMPFEHLRHYLTLYRQQAVSELTQFKQNLDSVTRISRDPPQGEAFEVFENTCRRLADMVFDLRLYIEDYLTELMNRLQGPVFYRRIPRRAPGDPSVKILTELATQENIEELRRMLESHRG